MSSYIYLGNDLMYNTIDKQLYVEKEIDGRIHYFKLCTEEQSDKIWNEA